MSRKLKDEFLALLESDKEFRYAVAGYLGLGEILRRLDRHEEELVKLREDFVRLREELVKLREDVREGFDLLRRHIDALGSRWGLLAERAFREGMRGIVEKHFGGKVERWRHYDKEGFVFGYPTVVDVDLVVKDEEHVLIEVKSSISRADVYELWKVGRLYERLKSVKPKLAAVSPYVDEDARKIAEELGIEVYVA